MDIPTRDLKGTLNAMDIPTRDPELSVVFRYGYPKCDVYTTSRPLVGVSILRLLGPLITRNTHGIFSLLFGSSFVGISARTPDPSARNSAVSYRIAAPIGVTDVRVQ